MDANSRTIDEFEILLQKRSSKKPPALYSSSEHKKETVNTCKTSKICSAKEVIANVAKQLKAIQNADTASSKRVGNKLDGYKKREFLTVDMIPVHSEVPQNTATKFETQCVTDTQLINVIENAEIIDGHGGITQEFDKTFCQKDVDDCDVKVNDASLKADEKTDTVIDVIKDIRVENDLNDKDTKLFENSNFITCEMDTVTYCQSDIITDNGEVDINISQDTEEFNTCAEIDENRSASPVLNTNRRKSISPLVVSLYAFENFENLAHPIIEEHKDLEIAKNLINSQIDGREICIPDRFYGNIDRESPVFSKIECITTNINKGDLEGIYTCSNEYIDEDFNNNEDTVNKDITETNDISGTKTTGSSLKITDIKDEILFSSDEEYEYLHRDVQELPLTCALETSFYDTPDVLDKTMYVGFQTASNKSIQIQTDSFYKAKSILSSINDEGSETTLTDLVKIFDSGQIVSENVPSVNLKNATQNNDINSKTSSENEHKVDENLPSITQNIIEQEQKIINDDTFQNVCLTELEHDQDNDIVMSQIIEFKRIPRSIKPLKEKINATFDNVALTALENNQLDDDVPMSQIIEFKSITRTPKLTENVYKTDVNNANSRPADVTKRKFEGFKTASNKKIKLSDKALARCKKVFQDIDLNDTESVNCESVNDNTDPELSSIKKGPESDISDNISHVAGAAIDQRKNDSQNKTDLKTQETESKIEDVDLQINDQILREFEDNDMPFEETNNNAFIGFKTASNKNIAISDNAMMKCKHLFQDIMTIDEDDYDKNAEDDDIEKQTVFKKPTSNIKKVTDKQIKLSNKAVAGVNNLPPAEKESNPKYDKCLDEHLLANVEDGDNLHTDVENKNSNPIENEFNCGIDTQDFFGEDLTRIENLFRESETENKTLESVVFKGFQTASMKAIAISEEALEKSKKLFEDITNKLDTDFQIKDVESKEEYENKKRIHSQKSNSTHVGYVSKELLVNASKEPYIEKPEKIDVTDFKEINTEPPKFVAFQTASSKPIRISAAAIERTKKMLSEFDLDDDHELVLDPKPSTSKFVGFQTASNKKIKISAKALAKGKQLLNDFELKDDVNEADSVTSVKHKDSISNQPCVPSTSKLIGFQTASNKEVKISDDALAESKMMLQDVDIFEKTIEELQDQKSNQVKDFQTASNKMVSISEKALKESRQFFHDNDDKEEKPEYVPVFQGFQTASNKEVKISKEAMAKSKKIFQDVDIFETESAVTSDTIEQKKESNEFKGFKTASNRKVAISEKALEKSRKLFHDNTTFAIDDKHAANESIKVFRGFQTASNKPVKISEEALARSKKMFQDVDVFENERECAQNEGKKEAEKLFSAFQTASNKTISISKKDLEKSRQLLNDNHTKDINNDNIGAKLMFRGFQTASNKAVKISDEALARSKRIFQDVDIFEEECETVSKNCKQKIENVCSSFQTASNKQVNISEKALEDSRKLFDGIDGFKDENCGPLFQGFQTASNKKVKISDESLAKSKKLFEDLNVSQIERISKTTCVEKKLKDLQRASKENIKDYEQTLVKTKDVVKDFKGTTAPEVKIRNHANVALRKPEVNSNINRINPEIGNSNIEKDVINTQVLNDFENTLNTEDFCKSTPKSKRSGSPILSCPRAKKRKFEAPHRSQKKVEPKSVFIPPKLAKTYKFDDEYKKHKKYTLIDTGQLEKEEKNKTSIDPYIFQFNFDTLLNFEFINTRNDYTKGKIDVEELKKIFLGSVNKKIVPDGWLDNHIKLIIWKLLSYEIKYPNVMKNTCTVRNVLEQLKYRYDRELYHVQRPILRKVLEKDEVPSKTMVLCVAAVYVDNVSVTSVNSSSQSVELLLTDGWYSVKACTDRMLVRLLAKGAIVVGTKMAVCGAELVNCEQGIAPWEDTSSVRLKLSGNSVRPCRWHTKLGLRTGLVQCPLGAVSADGGRVAAIKVLVTRVYPPLYVEKMEDGSTVTLSERLEHIRQMKYESEREAVMEKLYEEVEKEMSDQDSQDSESCSNDRGCLMDTGSQISKFMKKSADTDEYRSNLTKSQNRMLEEHTSKQREKLIERVRAKFQQKLEKNGLKTDRNVVPLLKVRVAGFEDKNGVVTKGYLSVWKPSAAVSELVTEGAWVEILNLIPTGIRNSEVQLSAGRQTVFNPYKQTNDKFKLYANTLKRKCYEIKEITQNPAMTTDYNEIDTVGLIFCIEPSTKEFDEKQSFQNVYLADADKNIVCVNFWGGLKKFGFENVLDTGQIITCVNLQKRAGNTRKSIPQYRVTEFSYFTKTPKDRKAMEVTNELSNKLSKNKEKFCQDCMLLKSNYSVFKTRNNENVSPYRFDYNIPKNIVSPLRKCDVNLNLTGLDFESSFDSQEISPQALLRKKKINERIEKIRLNYGEPPPLASIHIINKSKNASATYKSPLISNSERSKNYSETGLQIASPLSMDRTYVKSVNPVKLNFSNVSNLNDSIDHFADDFEASPPLSLDSDVVN